MLPHNVKEYILLKEESCGALIYPLIHFTRII